MTAQFAGRYTICERECGAQFQFASQLGAQWPDFCTWEPDVCKPYR